MSSADENASTTSAVVSIRFLGVFRTAAGTDKIAQPIGELSTIGRLVLGAVRALGRPRLRELLIDPELNDPRPNAIVMLNGREIGTLSGLETAVKPGDEIVLLPIAHGG